MSSVTQCPYPGRLYQWDQAHLNGCRANKGKSSDFTVMSWLWNLGCIITSNVTWQVFLSLFASVSLYVNVGNNYTYHEELLQGLNKLIYMKSLEQCLTGLFNLRYC